MSNKYSSIVQIIVMIFVSTSTIIAQEGSMKLYEPSPFLSLDSINDCLLLQSYQKEYERQDTLVDYCRNSEEVELGYCPKSKTIFSYYCRWYYDTSTKDEFSPNYIPESNDFLEKLKNELVEFYKPYFMNVLDSLNKRYGEPTFFVYNNSYDSPQTFEGYKLDTLKSDSYMKGDCTLEVIWDNTERKVILRYDKGTGGPGISYSYLNYSNQIRKNEELASLRQKEKLIALFIKCSIGFLITLMLFAIIIYSYRHAKLNREKRKKKEEEISNQMQIKERERIERQRQAEEQLKQLQEKENEYVSSLTEKYGNCDKTIKIRQLHPKNFVDILVFTQSKHVVIAKKELSFSDILECTVNDDIKVMETVQTFRDNSSATSKTDTGSMIGRAIAGGVLLGGAGAIIGGSTAKRNTVIEHGTDTSIHNKEIEHNYTVAITVKDISNPVININVRSDTALKDEIFSLMKVIISMK